MSFFAELKRRNVFRVGMAYIVMSWVLLQAADFALDLIGAPNWLIQSLFVLVALGLPVALFFAWAFELTPDGVKRESQVDRSESVTPQTRRKLDYVIISGVVLIAVYFIWESRFQTPEKGPDTFSGASAEKVSGPFSSVTPVDLVAGNSIAVLPFANRSNKEDDLFFTDGIHDDLLTQLAKLDDLKVISRTSVMEYRDTTRKISDIAAELGVSTILEGGVQRAGDRIRINAQLIDVRTDEHLWAETFDRELTIDNIFDIQTEITRQIVTAVRGELTASDAASLASDRPTNSLEAWEAFLQAKSIINTEPGYSAEKYLSAEPWVKKALEADPEFAEAWGLLSQVQLQGIWIGYADNDEQRELARTALERAVSLKPGTAAILRAQADYEYRVNLDYEKALALQEQARRLEPGNSETLHDIGTTLRRLGRWEDACEAFLQALALDPLNGFAATTYTETLMTMNAWDRLEFELDRLQARHPQSTDLVNQRVNLLIGGRGQVEEAGRYLDALPDPLQPALWEARSNVAGYRREWDATIAGLKAYPGEILSLPIFHFTKDLALGRLYAAKGENETARTYLQAYIDEFEGQPSGSVSGNGFRLANLAVAKVLLGETETAVELARQSRALMPLEHDWMHGGFFYRNECYVLARAGQRDLALEQIAARLDKPGGYSRWDLYLSPDWDFFRDDTRFNELVRPDGVEPEPFGRLGDGT